MDIGNIVDTGRTFDLKLLHPVEGNPTGVVFTLRSSESDEVKTIIKDNANKLLNRPKNIAVKAEDLEKEYLQKAAASIVSWDWGTDPKTNEPNDIDGEVPELSFEKAYEILSKHGWIYEQVATASEKRENFTKRS